MTELQIFELIDTEVNRLQNLLSHPRVLKDVIQKRISTLTTMKLTLNDLIKNSLT